MMPPPDSLVTVDIFVPMMGILVLLVVAECTIFRGVNVVDAAKRVGVATKRTCWRVGGGPLVSV